MTLHHYFRLLRVAGPLCLAIVLSSGCSHMKSELCTFCAPYETLKGDCRNERRARSIAGKIWDAKYAHCHVNHCDVKSLRDGFIDGFVDACQGGGGCPPMFAPEKHGILGCKSRQCSTSWHNGYPQGAAEALACGYCQVSCSKVHPCLRDVQRPVNPGCIRIEDAGYLAQNSPVQLNSYETDPLLHLTRPELQLGVDVFSSPEIAPEPPSIPMRDDGEALEPSALEPLEPASISVESSVSQIESPRLPVLAAAQQQTAEPFICRVQPSTELAAWAGSEFQPAINPSSYMSRIRRPELARPLGMRVID